MSLLKDLQQINKYYSEAELMLKEGNYKEGCNIIYDKLGLRLYDMSIDIMYNQEPYNKELDEIKDFAQTLKKLIIKVDNLIIKNSIELLEEENSNEIIDDYENIDINSEESEHFQGDIF